MSGMISAAVIGAGAVVYASNQASDAADQASATNRQALSDAERARLDEQDRLDEQKAAWEDMYGSIEQNLANSMARIDKRSYEVRGHTELEKQYSDASRRITDNLATRGIAGGISSGASRDLLTNLASDKATVSSEAESKALQDKANLFTTLGLNQKPGVEIASSAGVQLASTNLANSQYNAGQVAAQGTTNIGSALASGIGGIAGAYGSAVPTTPTQYTTQTPYTNSYFGNALTPSTSGQVTSMPSVFNS